MCPENGNKTKRVFLSPAPLPPEFDDDDEISPEEKYREYFHTSPRSSWIDEEEIRRQFDEEELRRQQIINEEELRAQFDEEEIRRQFDEEDLRRQFNLINDSIN